MSSADRHLLFGLLALQNGLIDQVQLVAAFQAWTRDKDRSLADHLVARGDLDAEDRAGVDAMVRLHVRKHGDVEKSLSAVPAGESTRQRLAALGDAELAESLTIVPPIPPADDSYATHVASVGTSTSGGLRFRVLRPHARGGLGAVFVALDDELHREVALKQIRDEYAGDPTNRQRFLLEAEITGGLEHPGIVPVYGLGSYTDGRPYYAMRFIRGDSLHDAIRQFHAPVEPRRAGTAHQDADAASAVGGAHPTKVDQRSLGLRKLLRRFLDVCNAIEYAHSRGVLHRDIKPGNIIVGKHGETLVVDWGLAKSLGHVEPGHESGERPLIPHSGSGSSGTLPGKVFGTPAFMSPEQAAGDLEKLGPRSDVYSLGATLYCLLTGKAPFEGDDLGVLLGQVQRGEFKPPRQLDSTIDRALEAVCLKAMRLKSEDRYGSCHELAEDVERWLADEAVTAYAEPFTRRARRWTNRHRTGMTAAAASLLVAFVGMASVLIVQARARARLDESVRREQKQFDLAREAIKSYTDGVREDETLKNPELGKLRTALLTRSLGFYRRLEDLLKSQTDDRSLSALAEAYTDLGHITFAIGDKSKALTAYHQARNMYLRLSKALPAVPAYLAELAKSDNNIGVVLREQGRSTEALNAFERGRELYERLVGANHAVADYKAGLARSYNNLGSLFRDMGKPDAATTAYERARSVNQQLSESNPSTAEFQISLATSYINIGLLCNATGKPADALEAYRKAQQIYLRLVESNPSKAEYRAGSAKSFSILGYLFRDTGKPAEALEAFQRAREGYQVLCKENPAVTAFQADLAVCHNYAGIMLASSGKPVEGLAAIKQAQEVLDRLCTANPSVAEYQADLARSHLSAGYVLYEDRKSSEALEEFIKSRDHHKILVGVHRTVVAYQADLARSENAVALTLSEAGKVEEARAAYERSEHIYHQLATEHAETPDYASGLGVTLNNIATLDLGANRLEQARDRIRDAVFWQKKALSTYPQHPTYRQGLTYHYTNLREVAQKLKDVSLLAEAERGLTELAASDPQLRALDVRLAAVMKGESTKDNAERLELSQRAYEVKRNALAVRLWSEAFEADPKLAEDRQKQHLYNAACAATLAAFGIGVGELPADEPAKVKLRGQAMGWLKKELFAWTKLVETGPPQAKEVVAQTLDHWQKDTDLASVRDPPALEKLPEAEKQAWRALWADVAALRAKL